MIAAPDAQTADILLDMLDDKLTIPIKRQRFLDMYNGIDVYQTRDYIKIACTSFVDKCCEKYRHVDENLYDVRIATNAASLQPNVDEKV